MTLEGSRGDGAPRMLCSEASVWLWIWLWICDSLSLPQADSSMIAQGRWLPDGPGAREWIVGNLVYCGDTLWSSVRLRCGSQCSFHRARLACPIAALWALGASASC